MIHKTNRTLLTIAALLLVPTAEAMQRKNASPPTALAAPLPYASMSISDLGKEKSRLRSEIERKKNDWEKESCLRGSTTRTIAALSGACSATCAVVAFDKNTMIDHGCNPTIVFISSAITALGFKFCLDYLSSEKENAAADEKRTLGEVEEAITQKEQQDHDAWSAYKRNKMQELISKKD